MDTLISDCGGRVLAGKPPADRKGTQVTQMNLLLDPELARQHDNRKRSTCACAPAHVRSNAAPS
jgi:hypothetical protein